MWQLQDEIWSPVLRLSMSIPLHRMSTAYFFLMFYRRLLGLAFVFLGADSVHASTRRECVARLSALTVSHPEGMNSIIVAGLNGVVNSPFPSFLQERDKEKSISELKSRRQARLVGILTSCSSYGQSAPESVKSEMTTIE